MPENVSVHEVWKLEIDLQARGRRRRGIAGEEAENEGAVGRRSRGGRVEDLVEDVGMDGVVAKAAVEDVVLMAVAGVEIVIVSAADEGVVAIVIEEGVVVAA